MRALVDALEEPALVVQGLSVGVANAAAQEVLGSAIEGRDVRLAIRHPEALEYILAGRAAELDVAGIGEAERPWRVIVRDLGRGSVFVRMIDRAPTVSAEKIRVDFVANASHELRTPLSTIAGYAETLAEEDDLSPEERTKFSNIIRDDARRMLRIIEDLMSLSRIEADRFVPPDELIDIAELVQASVAGAGSLRGAAHCGFEVDVAEDLPPLRGDRAQLAQVVDNLLSNAVHYGCEGPDSKIDVSARRSGRWVEVTIADHGPGIPREHLPRLTERFYRVDAARSRDSGGTGLGLAIVKHIIERHRGALEIKSTLGMGTNVTVRLPVAD